MGITFDKEQKTFRLDTPRSSYVIAIADEGFPGHAYYGRRLSSSDKTALYLRTEEPPYVPSRNARDRLSFYDSFPSEYPVSGIGDYRPSCFAAHDSLGREAGCLLYSGHRIFSGKPDLPGLPAAFAADSDCETLELLCRDSCLHLEVTLRYTVFSDTDAIARSVLIRNEGEAAVILTRALSASVEWDDLSRDILTLHGSWARERHIQRREAGYGSYAVSSLRGEPGHQDNPFLAVLSREASQESGEVFGANLVYSGNFIAEAYGGQFDTLRMNLGIHPEGFTWQLLPGDFFQTPECILVFSDHGIGGMTRTFHDLYRNHLIRSRFRDADRPVLLNSWEAVYFDIRSEKLLEMASASAALGIELFVLDDGWFGKRDSDNSSLGDWTVNESKLPGGLRALGDNIGKLGMRFGIWVEPEMVSPDSDLYRAHPDWAIAISGREPGLARNQYVLDYSRTDVREYIWGCLKKILSEAPVSYVKWDMNRPLSDLGSQALPPDRRGELSHRYVLGLYELLERLVTGFPDILLETCSGGGARFDPGMLYYSPQIWCSDDTDAVERLLIQEGTALVYPLSAIGSHVSDCPNHTVGRTTPIETRALVAMAGTFGYEMDITRIPEEDRSQIPEQIRRYKKHAALIRSGDYYRIAAYRETGTHDCWQIVSKDKRKTIVTYIQVRACPNIRSRRIRLQGLLPGKRYRLEATGEIFGGDCLMYGGWLFGPLKGDAAGVFLEFTLAED